MQLFLITQVTDEAPVVGPVVAATMVRERMMS